MTDKRSTRQSNKPPKPRAARDVVKAYLGKAPPKQPDHAMVRVANAIDHPTPGAVQCSRYGAPGGVYMALLAPKKRNPQDTKRGRNASPYRPEPAVSASKVRRVDHDEALNIIRRQPGEAGPDRVVELFWVPPEIVILLSRDAIKRLVERRGLLPVWDARVGRRLSRGAAVVRP